MCLIGACRLHNNVGMEKFMEIILFLLEPKNASHYILLSNIYVELGSWDDIQRVMKLMKYKGIESIHGCSWIVVKKRINFFLVGDKSHPQTSEIYGKLEKLSSEMKLVGYIPNTNTCVA